MNVVSPSKMYVDCTQRRRLLFEKTPRAVGFLRLLKNGLILCSASHIVKQIVQAVVPGMVDGGSPPHNSVCHRFPSIFRGTLQRFA